MIVYFADRELNILGQASTNLPKGLKITFDKKTEDVETGVAVLECKIHFNGNTRAQVEEFAEVGNYILQYKANEESKLYSIIEAETDTKKQTVIIYAEDDGLDLLNRVVGAYEADKAYPITHYIEKYAKGSGFTIGINEAKDLTRKLSWEGEATASERIASVATQFDGCEIDYSFVIDGLYVKEKHINIYKERGKDIGVTLYLNKDIDNIVTTKSISNLATALQCTGGTPEDNEEGEPITLNGYKYDDGDFYVDGSILKSRNALKRWKRYLWKTDESQQEGGHIVKQYSYDTTNQATLCKRAITELKSICDMEINYEVDIKRLPENAKTGDRINIVDDAGELYVSTRILMLETSETDQEYKATLGEHLIKTSGISQKVIELAAQFAKTAQSATRALAISNNAKTTAQGAKTQAEAAAAEAETAKQAATEAETVADAALQSAAAAQLAAEAAENKVTTVEENVTSLEKTIDEAQAAADQAWQAADTAQTKAEEAKTAAENAVVDATEAKEASVIAQEKADSAIAKSEVAQETAETAKTEADAAKTIADAAKIDAAAAQEDIDNLGENLTTLEETMTAEYTRKTELTEAEAALQAQITKNAADISSTVTKVATIDETANDAQEKAIAAQEVAAIAQTRAEQATADALAAQKAAGDATKAAEDAQNEADIAKAAASTAESVANKAEADLIAAKNDLATVSSRVDATEEEIAAAETAVNVAQAAADTAKADAAAAAQKAADAQAQADTAVANANAAQETANDAASKANLAQLTADEAKGNAAAAQTKADEAATIAAEAQETANTAKTNADTAKAAADAAAQKATNAQTAADDAASRATQAEADLETAKNNLANVTSRVDATEAEVEAAQEAVEIAQAAADTAKADAATAQSAADKAKADAVTANQKAEAAINEANKAQTAADEAQAAADAAQAAVDDLAVRVTKAETDIKQTSDAIQLTATKEEVEQKLSGYYTKEETDAALIIKSDEISSSVSSIKIGGRNLLCDSETERTISPSDNANAYLSYTPFTVPIIAGYAYTVSADVEFIGTAFERLSVIFFNENGVARGSATATIEKGHFEVTVPAVGVDACQLGIYCGILGNTGGNGFIVSKVMLEKGTKASNWVAAPEDVQGNIDAVEIVASDATKNIEEAQTLIQQLADNISTLVTDENGTSLMIQTSTGWAFSTSAIQNTVDDTSDKLSNLVFTVGSVEDAVENLDTAVKDLEKIAEYVTIGTYTYTDDEGVEQTEPSIDLYETDTGFRLKITNTRICFTDGANTLFYIDSKTKSINAEKVVTNEIQIGNIVIRTRANGNTGFVWKGAE